jgi:hypothetical protein
VLIYKQEDLTGGIYEMGSGVLIHMQSFTEISSGIPILTEDDTEIYRQQGDRINLLQDTRKVRHKTNT